MYPSRHFSLLLSVRVRFVTVNACLVLLTAFLAWTCHKGEDGAARLSGAKANSMQVIFMCV